MLQRIVAFLRLHVVGAILSTGLLGGLGGAVLTDFSNFRTANREFLKGQAEASQQADQDLINILRKFSDKARGRASTTDDDLKKLKENVGKSFLVASSLSERMPALKDDFTHYADALVQVQKSAEKLNGPADGKPFVEAISNYADKRDAFKRNVSSLQSRWPF